MPIYRKESLETLRQKIDLIEVLSSHLDLKRAGAAYKALCPFHDEKTPSFTIQKGDTHYHCFGCGAHGDAIQFLMTHTRLSFSEAVESLAQRFHVTLEQVEGNDEPRGPNKKLLIDALEKACHFYHFILLHTPEGHDALKYLYHRGIDLEFIRFFQLGLAPQSPELFQKFMFDQGIKNDVLLNAGLVIEGKKGNLRDFFYDRITIPIHNSSGAVIGFSARKYKETTQGGKYVNTSETTLFKKSRILFALNYSRRRIAKERKAIIVEGQLDALRLIQAGFNISVASQGTAFGEGHVQELVTLGINRVYLALDSDEAGQEAAVKIGNLFQKVGVEVLVVMLPPGHDPDSFLREEGHQAFIDALRGSGDYLSFLVKRLSSKINVSSPAGKQELIRTVVTQVRKWDQEVMVHESLRQLAHLMQVPESMIGLHQVEVPNLYIKKSDYAGIQEIDPDRILECDVLRWLLLMSNSKPHFHDLVKVNLKPQDFHVEVCQKIYSAYVNARENQQPCDAMSLIIALQDQDAQHLLSDLLHKKINPERSEEGFSEALQKILDRNWMHKREDIRLKIQAGLCSDEEALDLVKRFEEIRRQAPQVKKL